MNPLAFQVPEALRQAVAVQNLNARLARPTPPLIGPPVPAKAPEWLPLAVGIAAVALMIGMQPRRRGRS